jgi:hypothetical protein
MYNFTAMTIGSFLDAEKSIPTTPSPAKSLVL